MNPDPPVTSVRGKRSPSVAWRHLYVAVWCGLAVYSPPSGKGFDASSVPPSPLRSSGARIAGRELANLNTGGSPQRSAGGEGFWNGRTGWFLTSLVRVRPWMLDQRPSLRILRRATRLTPSAGKSTHAPPLPSLSSAEPVASFASVRPYGRLYSSGAETRAALATHCLEEPPPLRASALLGPDDYPDRSMLLRARGA